MSSVPANWSTIADAVRIRDEYGSKTLILGNGDVQDLADAEKKIKTTGADGVMIGRGIFGNPWLFASCHLASSEEPHPSLPFAVVKPHPSPPSAEGRSELDNPSPLQRRGQGEVSLAFA